MKAVIFVDVQNDFVTGSLGSEWAKNVAPKIIEFANDCRELGYIMFATRDSHNSDYEQTLEGELLPVKHCQNGEVGYELIDNLQKTNDGKINILGGNIIDKPTFGSFDLLYKLQTWFEEDKPEHLNSNTSIWPIRNEFSCEPLDEIIICGFVTSICVISNALMLRAKYPNVKITVIKNLCADVDEESHDAALKVMQNCQINIM